MYYIQNERSYCARASVKKALTSIVTHTAIVISSLGYGHRLEYIATEIVVKPKSIQLSHRFDRHDMEHAVKSLFGKHTEQSQQNELMASYIDESFQLNIEQQPLKLVLLGYETEGKFLWVYQESEPLDTDSIKAITIESDILFDVFPQQTQWINVKHDGKVQSASLTSENRSTHFSFAQ